MTRCSYTWSKWNEEKREYVEVQCPEETWEGSDKFCIFHDPSPEKNADLFKEKLEKQMESEIERHNFAGYYFPEYWDFSGKEFGIDADFRGATFQDANFSGAIFQGTAGFWGAIFQGTANFSGATFQDAYFWGAIFKGTANFSGATFQNAYFSGATFQNANFSGATFQGTANFSGATFQNTVDFRETKFPGTAEFRETKFKGYAEFNKTTFHYVNFKRAIFLTTNFSEAEFQNADFSKAKFQEYTDFSKAKFQENTDFKRVNFQDANFGGATFQDNAYFSGATFQDNAYFGGATFQNIADFFGAVYQGTADFREATFQDVDFNTATFYKEVELAPENIEKIDLRYTKFLFRSFITADLTKALFHRCFTENMIFVDCIWPKCKGLFGSYTCIYEEKHMKDKDISFNQLETIYRDLKQNMQNHGDYDTAGEFYYREMEMRRKQYKILSPRWCKQNTLRLLCGYGERPLRVIGMAIIIVIFSAFLFQYWGIVMGEHTTEEQIIDYDLNLAFPTWNGVKDYLQCLYYSFVTFTTLGYGDVHPIGCSKIIACAESFTGAFFIALFVLVFGRKMLR